MPPKILDYYKQLVRLAALEVDFSHWQHDPVDAGDTLGFLTLIRAAWDKPVTTIAVIEEAIVTLGKAHACVACGGNHVIPEWVAHYKHWGNFDRYGSVDGRSPRRCLDCATSGISIPQTPTGGTCPACNGSGLLPKWGSRAIDAANGPKPPREVGPIGELEELAANVTARKWLTTAPEQGKHWFPAFCRACGGWGVSPLFPSPLQKVSEPRVISNALLSGSSQTDGALAQRSWSRRAGVLNVVFDGRVITPMRDT